VSCSSSVVINNYNWSNASGYAYNQPTFTGSAGNYSLTVGYYNGCSATTNFTISQATLPVANIVKDSTCLPTNLTQINTSSNYTYLWNTGDTTASILATASMLYKIWVTDTTTGCVSVDSIIICPQGLGCPSLGYITCPGESATICFIPCNTSSILQYQWLGYPNTTQCLTVFAPGSYFQTVTDTQTGATITVEHIVVEAFPYAEILGDTVICIGENIHLFAANPVTPGATFEWTVNGIVISNQSSVIIPSINYSSNIIVGLQVFSANGNCWDTDSVGITLLEAMSGISGPSIICEGDFITLYPTDTSSAFSYLWQWNGGTSTDSILNIQINAPQWITLTITNGICNTSYSHWVDFYNEFNFSFNGTFVFCTGGGTSIGLGISDSLYNVSWSNGDSTTIAYFDSSGTYYVSVTSVLTGCTVTSSITIGSANITPPTIGGGTILCQGHSITLYVINPDPSYIYIWTYGSVGTSVTYTDPGTYSLLAIDPLTGCIFYQEITIIEIPPITPIFFPINPICEGDFIPALPTISINGVFGFWSPALNNTVTTNYTFTPFIGECANTINITIVVIPGIDPTFTLVDTICKGDILIPLPTVSLNGILGSWSPALNNMATTNYMFTPIPILGQCINDTTITIVVKEKITPTFTLTDTICEGEIILSFPNISDNGYTGNWSPTINNISTTTYLFTVDSNQCATNTNSTLVVKQKSVSLFDNIPDICYADGIITLATTSNNGFSGSWFPNVNNTITTTYYFTPNTNECALNDSVTIVVNPLPILSLDLTDVCLGTNSFYIDHASPTGGVYTIDGVNTNFFDVENLSVGSYIVNYSYTDIVTNCSNSITSQIEIHPSPISEFTISPSEINIGNPIIELNNESINISNSIWQLGDGNITFDSLNFYHSYADTGEFTITYIIFDYNNCSDTSVKSIYINPSYIIYIPNAFTPTNDGNNDSFYPVIQGYKEYELFIFNKWGGEIYRELNGKWDGTYKGSIVQLGVYTYLINVIDFNNKKHNYTGTVTLIE
jgi:gliding motility-associated-like protein